MCKFFITSVHLVLLINCKNLKCVSGQQSGLKTGWSVKLKGLWSTQSAAGGK